MERDPRSPGDGAGGLAEVRGLAFGVEIRGRLPAGFAPFLRPSAAGPGEPGRELEVTYRTVPRLAGVEEIWAAEPRPPATRDRLALFRCPEGFGLTVRSEGAGLFRIGARRIEVEWLPGGAGAAHFFFSHALPLWLESRGVTVLHASAVARGDRVAAFLGPSGVGKSTLCAELVGAGWGFVADDGLALEEDDRGAWRCLPGPPWLRLWPSALEGRLGIPAAELPRVHETLEKRRLAVGGPDTTPLAGDLTLAAVYLLDRAAEEGGGAQDLDLPACSRGEALVRLVEHSLAAAPLAALGLAGERLDRLARLASGVEVRRLRLPAGEEAAHRVREVLLAGVGGGGGGGEAANGGSGVADRPGAPPGGATAPAAPGDAGDRGRPAAGDPGAERFAPSPRVRARRVGEETVLLDLGSDRYFALNEVGAEIWAGLERGLDRGEILAALLAAFDAEEEMVRRDLDALLAELLAEGLIRPGAR
jgi:hypothetical protein